MKITNSVFIIIIFCLASIIGSAQTDTTAMRIKALENRISILEKKVISLEKKLSAQVGRDQPKDSTLSRLQKMARSRMDKDSKIYSQEEFTKAEQLYAKGSRDVTSDEGKKHLQEVVEKYPKMNRAGCAALYLAQEEEGPQREKMLTDAFEKYGDCMYLDGVQVGAYGRYKLALMYKSKDVTKAKELMNHIRKNYPNAVDHDGKKLEMDLHD